MSLIYLRQALDRSDYIFKNRQKIVFHNNSISQLSPIVYNEVNKKEDQFENYQMVLLETTILQSIDYGKSLPLYNKGEYAKALAEFNNTF